MDTLSFETVTVRIEDEAALEEVLSRPSQAPIDDLRGIEGDVPISGVGGKPTRFQVRDGRF